MNDKEEKCTPENPCDWKPTQIEAAESILSRHLQSEWVSVEERLPNTFEQVLVCLRPVPKGPDWYPRTNIFLGWHRRSTWFGSFVNPLTGIPESGEFPDDIITHWRPLPAPPEETSK